MQPSAIWQFSLESVHALIWGGPLLIALIVFARLVPLRALVISTTVVTLVLVMLGAYVRLTNAGLGCPDWPGCYGKFSPGFAAEQISAAEAEAPAGPVSLPKAWKEMVHRYLASLVGVMILAIAYQALRGARRRDAGPGAKIGLPLALVLLVVLQGLFGKWTVTLLLKPVIVTLHLLGGMALVALLAWLSARLLELRAGPPSMLRGIRPWALSALIVLVLQIVLGGWVSTNYAALACTDFPTCHGRWLPPMDFDHGFHFLRELGMTAQGEPLSNDALNAIHWAHRVGAVVTCIIVGWTGLRSLRIRDLHGYATALLGLLALQVALGITNILASLPLPAAVAHNGVAALLLMTLVMLNFAVNSPTTFRR
ncbi:MAG TPA: COX15/CtaA family protein [Burkholderiales bacterium]